MKLFAHREVKEAKAHALAGGQALHVWTPPAAGWPGAPTCFQRSRQWAHLFDQDKARLEATARRLGVRKIVIHGDGAGQHVDLCGAPLKKAMIEAEGEEIHG
ncbi:hypothetical protein [Desulfocurvibacter africanus]|uniref:Uncharacterized protein n=1 Tax=Desulfocurvibacter africanus subsp. africanus str. Walvis Bay TaxID=690850 RepID=F3Z331_DESAF|nr:hypothetical protein [Desulfocurvibacter africanus]EGJ50275.1 hypothetical protein Desaf_1946 [Desulfocurvibacter africanus subsp. africanus str. Walvis Bay]